MAKSGSKVIVVSKTNGDTIAKWLETTQNIVAAKIVPYIKSDEAIEATVVGFVPTHIGAKAHMVLTIDCTVQTPEDLRGVNPMDYTYEQLITNGARLKRYYVFDAEFVDKHIGNTEEDSIAEIEIQPAYGGHQVKFRDPEEGEDLFLEADTGSDILGAIKKGLNWMRRKRMVNNFDSAGNPLGAWFPK